MVIDALQGDFGNIVAKPDQLVLCVGNGLLCVPCGVDGVRGIPPGIVTGLLCGQLG